MKKIFALTTVMLALSLSLSSCGSKDEPSTGGHDVMDYTAMMLTHATNISTGEVEAVAFKTQLFRVDRTSNVASFQLANGISRPNIPSLVVDNVPLTKSESSNLYTFNAATTTSSYISNFSGEINFNDYTLKLDYVESNTWHVVAIHPTLSYLKSETVVTDGNGDNSNTPIGAVYTFVVNPETKKASVRLSNIQLASDQRAWQHILTTEASLATVEFTAEGFHITGEGLSTEGYLAGAAISDDTKQTTITIKSLDAKLNLSKDEMTITARLHNVDRDYIVTATGKVK